MANVLVDDQYLKNIGDAIRSKNNSSLKYKPSEMANMIRGLQIGDPSINVYSNDAWKYNIDQKEHQTINVEVAASFSGDNNTGYFSKLYFTPSISSNYGYNAGTIRKTIDEINHIANFTADDATELDGYITDGWAGVYVINNNYYRNSGSSTVPKLEQVPTNSSIENLLILGYYTVTTVSTPITTNTVANYAPSLTSSLKKYQNKYATSIGNSAFKGCSSLTSIDVSNATSIGEYAFNGCSSLTSIDVSNATSIGNSAFKGCSSLTSIDVSNATSIGNSAFKGCSSLTSIDVSNATSIVEYAFSGCSSLTSIDVSNATSINDYSFYGDSLKYLIINNTTPPVLNSTRVHINSSKILVPRSALRTYKAATGWSSCASQFDVIENYEITKENGQITITKKNNS